MSTDNKTPKAPKKKGPLRLEAIIPVTIIMVGSIVYFSYFFDSHLKKGIEWAATQANGAEVNVANVKTSFIKGEFLMEKIEVTDSAIPSTNLVEVGAVHFKYLWDALLRMKFVVEDASIDVIQMGTKRAKPGFVIPPPPPSESKISAMQDEVMGQVKDYFQGSGLGELMDIIGGQDPKEKLKEIRESLKSEKRINEMVAELKVKNEEWDKSFTKLSDPTVFNSIQEEAKLISESKDIKDKLKNAKNLADLIKKADKQFKEIKSEAAVLQKDIGRISKYPTEVQDLIKADVAQLQDQFKIPKIDVKDLSMYLFAKEFGTYLAKARKYQALAKEYGQYIPKKKEEDKLIPPPRKVGKTYEFPITTGYPLFWLKHSGISSKSSQGPFSGDFEGDLYDVTTDAKLINKPIVLKLAGNLPHQQITGIKANVVVDLRENPSQSIELKVAHYPVMEKLFTDSESFKFGLKKAKGAFDFKAKLQDGTVDVNWNNTLTTVEYITVTKSALAQDILTKTLAGIPTVNLNAHVDGPWSKLNWSINSNLGVELGNGIKNQVEAKLNEAKQQITDMVDGKTSAGQSELLTQLNIGGEQKAKIDKVLKTVTDAKKKLDDQLKDTKNGEKNKAINKAKDGAKKLLKGFGL